LLSFPVVFSRQRIRSDAFLFVKWSVVLWQPQVTAHYVRVTQQTSSKRSARNRRERVAADTAQNRKQLKLFKLR